MVEIRRTRAVQSQPSRQVGETGRSIPDWGNLLDIAIQGDQLTGCITIGQLELACQPCASARRSTMKVARMLPRGFRPYHSSPHTQNTQSAMRLQDPHTTTKGLLQLGARQTPNVAA